MQALNCPKCGAPLRANVSSCPYCGVGLIPDSPEERSPRPARQQPPAEVPPGWRLHRDDWHGFTLSVPPGWRVETNHGQIGVREDAVGLIQAVILPIRLPNPSTARQMAAFFVNAGSKFSKNFQAWEQGGAAPDSNRISLRVSEVSLGQQLDGAYNILVEGQNCVISGYEAPRQVISARSPVLSQILSSFRMAAMMPRQEADEPREGAYRISLPTGWFFEGEINRNTTGRVGLPCFLAAADPERKIMAAMASTQWVYQDLTSAFAFGWMGMEVKSFMTADQYCSKHVAKEVAKRQKNFRQESITLRPDLAQIEDNTLVQMGYPAGAFQTSIAIMDITYDENGTRIRQRMRVATQRQVKTIGYFSNFNPYWTAMINVFFRTPEGQMDAWEPVLQGVLDSVQVNPNWQKREQQRIAYEEQMMQNYIAQAQADMASRRAQISQTLSETSNLVNNTYWNQQPTYNRLSELYSNNTLSQQNVISDSGDTYKVPYGYDQYWQDGLGNLLGGSWMVTPGIDWKPLTPTGT